MKQKIASNHRQKKEKNQTMQLVVCTALAILFAVYIFNKIVNDAPEVLHKCDYK
jgi:hypothetical protein